jgi:hypothetical protein
MPNYHALVEVLKYVKLYAIIYLLKLCR